MNPRATAICIVGLGALLFVRCSETPMRFSHPSATPEQFKRDDWECTRDSRTTLIGSAGTSLDSQVQARMQEANALRMSKTLYLKCMEGHGWTREASR
jgi:hypothetical protein